MEHIVSYTSIIEIKVQSPTNIESEESKQPGSIAQNTVQVKTSTQTIGMRIITLFFVLIKSHKILDKVQKFTQRVVF